MCECGNRFSLCGVDLSIFMIQNAPSVAIDCLFISRVGRPWSRFLCRKFHNDGSMLNEPNAPPMRPERTEQRRFLGQIPSASLVQHLDYRNEQICVC
jgi:hypothetical protein